MSGLIGPSELFRDGYREQLAGIRHDADAIISSQLGPLPLALRVVPVAFPYMQDSYVVGA
jgi:hypothetical protein